MLSDIEIAQQATLLPVKEVAAQIGITEDELEFYGKYKAKLSRPLQVKVKPLPPQVWDRLWLKSERRQSLP